jgi:hypothetical protein
MKHACTQKPNKLQKTIIDEIEQMRETVNLENLRGVT